MRSRFNIGNMLLGSGDVYSYVCHNIIFVYPSFIVSASVHIYSLFSLVKSGFLPITCYEGTEGGVEV